MPQPMNQVVPTEQAPKRSEIRVVHDSIAVFDTAMFEHMQRVATLMASCSLVPDHLRGEVADCFLVVNQARHWNMDPFGVAQGASVVKGKLCFEGKIIAAAIASDPGMDGPLNYEYSGEGLARKIIVSGYLKNEAEPRTIAGTVEQWKTNNEYWVKDPDQMLAYRGARQWARRHKPDRLLGVYAPDEFDEPQVKDITPTPSKRTTKKAMAEEFQAAKAGDVPVTGGTGGAGRIPKASEVEPLEASLARVSREKGGETGAFTRGREDWARNAGRSQWPSLWAPDLIAEWQKGWDAARDEALKREAEMMDEVNNAADRIEWKDEEPAT